MSTSNELNLNKGEGIVSVIVAENFANAIIWKVNVSEPEKVFLRR